MWLSQLTFPFSLFSPFHMQTCECNASEESQDKAENRRGLQVTVTFNIHFIYSKSRFNRQRDRKGETERDTNRKRAREIFCLLVHSSNGCNMQD